MPQDGFSKVCEAPIAVYINLMKTIVGAGFVAEVRWERSKGVVMKPDHSFTPSAVSKTSGMR